MKKLLCCLTAAGALSLATAVSARNHTEYLPTNTEWLEHASYLARYWMHPDAKGIPEGNFPTWRCNDGTLRNGKACPDETNPGDLLRLSNLDYVRMQSRQTYTYGALFHVTGDPEALRLHKAGVKFLLEKARDPEGGFNSLMFKGEPYISDNNVITNSRLARTSQDQAYALVGLAMNAYLTHDPEVIKVIVDTQKYIFDTYYDKDQGYIRWCFENSYFNRKDQIELVAILDQLYSYMLLTWRLVPEAEQARWTSDIKRAVADLNKTFYNSEGNRYWGCTHDKSCFNTDTGRHQDNGHRVKSFWLQYLVANTLQDEKLKDFAKRGIVQTLKGALVHNKDGWFENDHLNEASWWVYDLLDISALTLALTGDYEIPDTFHVWLNEYTDKEYGDIKNLGLKTHFWRNGFHNAEHLLIGMLLSNEIRYKQCTTGQCRKNNETTLYFAPIRKSDKNFFPYLFKGNVKSSSEENGVMKVKFADIKL